MNKSILTPAFRLVACIAFIVGVVGMRGSVAAAATTDPRRADTDGDGYADGPDVWVQAGESGLMLLAGEDLNGNGKYEPAGEDGILDTADDETDPNNPSSHPVSSKILALDLDMDGLPDSWEEEYGSLPDDADTDDDGVGDGAEVLVYGTDPLMPDSDMDGLTDAVELGIGTARFPEDVTVGNYIGFRRGLGSLVRVPRYVERSTLPSRSNPWDIDSDYDGILDREEDWNGNGLIDPPYVEDGDTITESDPACGLAALPYTTFEKLNYRRSLLGSDPFSRVLPWSPPVSRHGYMIFFFNDEDPEDHHWEAIVGLSKGHGQDYPSIAISPSGAATVEPVDWPTAGEWGLQAWKVRTAGAGITKFMVEVREPLGNLIFSYPIMLNEDDHRAWQEQGYGFGQQQHASRSGGQYLLTAYVPSIAGHKAFTGPASFLLTQGGGGDDNPPVGRAEIYDYEEGAFLTSQIGFDIIPFFDSETYVAMYVAAKSVAVQFYQGTLQISLPSMSDAALFLARETIEDMTIAAQITLNLTFRMIGMPLEYWIILIQHWRYNYWLEAPEEFLWMSVFHTYGLADHSILLSALNSLEEERGWYNIWGYPRYFVYGALDIALSEEQLGQLPPGFVQVPGPAPEEEDEVSSELTFFGDDAAPTVRTLLSPVDRDLEFFGDDNSVPWLQVKSDHKTAHARGKAAYRYGIAYQALAETDVKAGKIPAIGKASLVMKCQYHGGKGTDFICVGADGTIYIVEVKAGQDAQFGKLKRSKSVQLGPRWVMHSDLRHLIDGDGNNLMVQDTIDKRLADIQAKTTQHPEVRQYYEAMKQYADDVMNPNSPLHQEFLADSQTRKDYKLPDKPSTQLSKDFLIEFKDKEARLFWDYMEKYHPGHALACATFWAKARPLALLHAKNKQMRIGAEGNVKTEYNVFGKALKERFKGKLPDIKLLKSRMGTRRMLEKLI